MTSVQNLFVYNLILWMNECAPMRACVHSSLCTYIRL